MSLDHGILNVPLSKRGNIDRDIDAYKAQQAAQARAKAKADAALRDEQKGQALAMIDRLSAVRVSELARHVGRTPKQLVKWLKSEAHWRPQFVLRALAQEVTT